MKHSALFKVPLEFRKQEKASSLFEATWLACRWEEVMGYELKVPRNLN